MKHLTTQLQSMSVLCQLGSWKLAQCLEDSRLTQSFLGLDGSNTVAQVQVVFSKLCVLAGIQGPCDGVQWSKDPDWKIRLIQPDSGVSQRVYLEAQLIGPGLLTKA